MGISAEEVPAVPWPLPRVDSSSRVGDACGREDPACRGSVRRAGERPRAARQELATHGAADPARSTGPQAQRRPCPCRPSLQVLHGPKAPCRGAPQAPAAGPRAIPARGPDPSSTQGSPALRREGQVVRHPLPPSTLWSTAQVRPWAGPCGPEPLGEAPVRSRGAALAAVPAVCPAGWPCGPAALPALKAEGQGGDPPHVQARPLCVDSTQASPRPPGASPPRSLSCRHTGVGCGLEGCRSAVCPWEALGPRLHRWCPQLSHGASWAPPRVPPCTHAGETPWFLLGLAGCGSRTLGGDAASFPKEPFILKYVRIRCPRLGNRGEHE